MELKLQVHEVKRDPPAGCRGTWSTEQIQNILERSKQSQQGMLPNLKTCLENAFWFLLSSFLGDSQIGTAFPACQGLSPTCLGSAVFAAEESLCHLTSFFGRRKIRGSTATFTPYSCLGEVIWIPSEIPQRESAWLLPNV